MVNVWKAYINRANNGLITYNGLDCIFSGYFLFVLHHVLFFVKTDKINHKSKKINEDV